MKKTAVMIFAFLLVFRALSAQNAIRVDAPNLVSSDEQFNVTFIIEGENAPSSFEWEQCPDFQLVWGPQKGSSTSISIINGKRTKSSQTTYTYILLPKRAGKFQLPSASAVIKGETVTSPAVTVEVVADGSPQGNPSGGQASSAAPAGDIASKDLFLRLSFSRTSVVVGEPVNVTLKLYQRVSIAGFEDAKFPTFNGFWSQEVQTPSNIEFTRENVGGELYNSAVLRSWVIIPQQAGVITIDPAELVCLVNIRTQSAPKSIFDSFFEDDIRTIRKRVTTDRHTVNVRSLPSGAPSSFGGGVGTFSLAASLSKDSLKTHEAASLLITVSGKGNVSLLEAPKVSFPPDFECYDVKVVENTDKADGKTSGTKTFEFPFIPRSAGEFTIDPVKYSYYDVNSHGYVTLETRGMALKVEKGADTGTSDGGQIVQTVHGKDVKNLGSDIRFIRTKSQAFTAKGAFFLASALFWTLLGLLVAGGACIGLLMKRLSDRRADVAGTRNRGASKMALKRLAKADAYLGASNYSAFYEELHRALTGYISDKLNIDMADMSKENIDATLRMNGCPEPLSTAFVSLIDACEFARYSPSPDYDAMNVHYHNALDVISGIDSNMKRKGSGKRLASVLLIAALMLPGLGVRADSLTDSLWTAGVDAYSEGRWQEAVDAWTSISDSGLESVELYYNMGNAFFKQGDVASAVLNYERALKLDPSDEDVRFNLEHARTFLSDKIDIVPEFFLKTWGRKVRSVMSSDGWAVLFLSFTAILVICVLVFFLSRIQRRRVIAFYAGIMVLVLALFSVFSAARLWKEYRSEDTAIVMKPVVSVKSSPSGDASKDLFILHEGTKVRLLDSVGEWTNVSLSDGRQGWMKTSDIEVIR